MRLPALRRRALRAHSACPMLAARHLALAGERQAPPAGDRMALARRSRKFRAQWAAARIPRFDDHGRTPTLSPRDARAGRHRRAGGGPPRAAPTRRTPDARSRRLAWALRG